LSSIKNIYIFGPQKIKDRYKNSVIIDEAINYLRQFFGIDDLVFHGLRHSFSSILIIRWYALFHSPFIQYFSFKNNEIFEEKARKKLAQLFSLNNSNPLDHTKPTDLIVISKIMGHLGQETLFRSYIHIFHLILDYVVRFLDGEFRDTEKYYY